MRQRFMTTVAVFMIFKKGESVLLLKRVHTGYMDGHFSLPAGGLEKNESLIAGAIREAREETGVALSEQKVRFAHLQHCTFHGNTWINCYFMTDAAHYNPTVTEAHLHEDMQYAPLDALPTEIIPYVKEALINIRKGILYSTFMD